MIRMKKIVQKNDKILRARSEEVPVPEITGAKIKKVLREMDEALDAEPDGVALAAPQIGYSLRIFVISGKYFDTDFRERTKEELEAGTRNDNFVFINPKLLKRSAKKMEIDEGCLSVRWLYGKMKRSEKATVTAYDGSGKKFTRGATGLLAQIFQHEIDHLDGILFTDTAKDLVKIDPSEKQDEPKTKH
jgi:peptide deformylase